jgi:hypothetical protein
MHTIVDILLESAIPVEEAIARARSEHGAAER